MEYLHKDMSDGKTGKEFITWKAYQVFREKGYYHTSMADIGQACGLLKGSIYHHFSSKEQLMEQVLKTAHLYVRDTTFQIAFQEQISPKKRLQQILESMDTFFFDQEGGCLMSSIGLEVGDRIPEFAAIIRQFFQDWIHSFTYLFETQYDHGKASELARLSVQEIEGGVMLSCIFKDKIYFLTSSQRTLEYLK